MDVVVTGPEARRNRGLGTVALGWRSSRWHGLRRLRILWGSQVMGDWLGFRGRKGALFRLWTCCRSLTSQNRSIGICWSIWRGAGVALTLGFGASRV